MGKKMLVLIFGTTLWFIPPPEGISLEAWYLFTIFITTIFSVVFGVIGILVASMLGLVVAIFTKTLSPEVAFSGFSNDIVLLIVMAFLIAKAVVKSGLGNRIALHMIARFGKTTLGLGYSMIATDMLIAPAFPSNTARSGLLFPIVYSVAIANGSDPEKGTEKKIGSFLMFASMLGIGLSSALWLTAMAVNPAGAAIASEYGLEINFGSWILAASVPTIFAAIVLPWLLYKIYPPEVKTTPDAPVYAKEQLAKMGGLSRNEKITAAVFVLLIIAWAFSETWGINRTATAFLGLGLLLLTNVFELEDIRKEGEALITMIWFAILFTMSSALNEMGFMNYVGSLLSEQIAVFASPVAFILLVLIYVLLHYLFVSQTAHLLALFGVFMGAGESLGLNLMLLAYMLLFATNYFSVITPQGSSCNVLYLSSGYIKQNDVYKLGGLMTFLSATIYLTLGIGWLLLVG
jgi:DASS family divalent anion:Na+ symporter